ncbi:formyl transferase [Alsobacter soli]|uniref:Formyl transferase n=1 Tax=Alsobacter soli TaxID=2109933 RepID=A0A2T1HWP2_9HYPH|nr:glycoside hydrolase family 43 protein [Alsobacter soli]PSC06117.1 formyl transferase [Alsobacter soli]
MRIALVARGGVARSWHGDLARRLRSAGHEVVSCRVSGEDDLPPALRNLIWFERSLFGRTLRALEPVSEASQPGALPAEPEAELVIALDEVDLPGQTPVLRASFDGRFGWSALYEALLAERSPHIAIVRDPDGVVLAEGVAALPQPALFCTSLDATLARLANLFAAAAEPGAAPSARRAARPKATPAPPVAFATAHLARAVGRKLRALVEHPIHWRIGWRRLDGAPDLFESLSWPATGYTWFQPGPGVYVADPFVVERDGRTHVFCEVFHHADPRGRIGVFTLDRDGVPGPLRIVLERPYHLSYPFVFERDGQVWMIPETYENRSVELYRAVRFPDVWEHEADLCTGVELSDVTIAEHDGRFWMFAAETAGGPTTWDALSLFMADHWRGPWRAHPANPVLIDAQAGRPAGQLVRRGKTLLRPAQDSRTGYGSGLSICRVDRLDPEGYAQTTLSTLRPLGRRDTGAHTLNVGSGFELVDHCSPMLRW